MIQQDGEISVFSLLFGLFSCIMVTYLLFAEAFYCIFYLIFNTFGRALLSIELVAPCEMEWEKLFRGKGTL